MEKQIHRHRFKDGQTDKQTQIERWTNRQTDFKIDTQTKMYTDRLKYGQTNRQTDILKDGQTNRQTERFIKRRRARVVGWI
jgi:hypothetical protein